MYSSPFFDVFLQYPLTLQFFTNASPWSLAKPTLSHTRPIAACHYLHSPHQSSSYHGTFLTTSLLLMPSTYLPAQKIQPPQHQRLHLLSIPVPGYHQHYHAPPSRSTTSSRSETVPFKRQVSSPTHDIDNSSSIQSRNGMTATKGIGAVQLMCPPKTLFYGKVNLIYIAPCSRGNISSDSRASWKYWGFCRSCACCTCRSDFFVSSMPKRKLG